MNGRGASLRPSTCHRWYSTCTPGNGGGGEATQAPARRVIEVFVVAAFSVFGDRLGGLVNIDVGADRLRPPRQDLKLQLREDRALHLRHELRERADVDAEALAASGAGLHQRGP